MAGEHETAPRHTVLVVDDQELVADTLARAIDAEDDLVFVGSATTASDAYRVALERQPDVVVIDSRLPDATGAQTGAAIRQALPETAIVMLGEEPDPVTIAVASDTRSFGFASKDESFNELIDTIRQVTLARDSATPARNGDGATTSRRVTADCYALTPREFEVIQLLAHGRSTGEIVDELVVSIHTVRNHVRNILAKLGARSRVEAVSIAIREGLAHVPPSET
jgi:DNA-binding NarL/FixJ family response regulator